MEVGGSVGRGEERNPRDGHEAVADPDAAGLAGQPVAQPAERRRRRCAVLVERRVNLWGGAAAASEAPFRCFQKMTNDGRCSGLSIG